VARTRAHSFCVRGPDDLFTRWGPRGALLPLRCIHTHTHTHTHTAHTHSTHTHKLRQCGAVTGHTHTHTHTQHTHTHTHTQHNTHTHTHTHRLRQYGALTEYTHIHTHTHTLTRTHTQELLKESRALAERTGSVSSSLCFAGQPPRYIIFTTYGSHTYYSTQGPHISRAHGNCFKFTSLRRQGYYRYWFYYYSIGIGFIITHLLIYSFHLLIYSFNNKTNTNNLKVSKVSALLYCRYKVPILTI
jgi:hypothetical protein